MKLSEVDRDKLRKGISEMDSSMTRVDAERDLQKEIVNTLHEKLDMEKKVIRRIARSHHRATFATEQEENALFEEVYTEVITK